MGEGSIAYKKDQFCAHPSVLSYENVVVSLNGWVHTLQEFLDASGYTADLHSALSDVANYVSVEASGATAGPTGADSRRASGSSVRSASSSVESSSSSVRSRVPRSFDALERIWL